MRLVAVSMVKDEEDAVEAFVRHTLAAADHAILFDHHSTDRTGLILHRLAAEGLPVTVLTDDEFEYRQAARTTALIRLAVREFRADWVLPLDADEFVQAGSPAAFRAALAAHPAPHLRLPLVNFGPHPADDRRQPNPLLRLRHKLRRVDTAKVAVGRGLVETPGFAVGTGNHTASLDGSDLPSADAPGLWLAHFPIRSGWQAAMKVALHQTQQRAGGYGAGGTHYGLHFARLLIDPARFVAEPEQYLRGEVEEPAAYWGGELKYTTPPDADPQRLTRGLLALTARLADSHGRWRAAAERAGRPGVFGRLVAGLRRRFGRRPAEAFHFRPADLPDSRSPELLAGDVRLDQSWVIGNQQYGRVRVTNTGGAVWRAADGVGQVNVGIRVFAAGGELLHADWRRVPMPGDVYPGDELVLDFACTRADDRHLMAGLVAEGLTWFGNPVRVNPPGQPSISADPSPPPPAGPASSIPG